MLETWFATLGPRLGVALAGTQAGEGAPKELRQALDKLWVTAVASARDEADRALEPERDRLAQQGLKLDIARQELLQREVALTERGIALEHALELAKSQLQDQAAQLEKARSELDQARGSLATLVQERDSNRRQLDEHLRALAEERQRIEQRASASERRLLEEVDRARQEAKQSARALEDAVQKHVTEKQALERTSTALSNRVHEGQVESAALKERLKGAEQRATGLENALAAAAAKPPRTDKSRPAKSSTTDRRPARVAKRTP